MNLTPEVKAEILSLVESYLTEEKTDALITELIDKIHLPWWVPKRVIVSALDAILPELLMGVLKKAFA